MKVLITNVGETIWRYVDALNNAGIKLGKLLCIDWNGNLTYHDWNHYKQKNRENREHTFVEATLNGLEDILKIIKATGENVIIKDEHWEISHRSLSYDLVIVIYDDYVE